MATQETPLSLAPRFLGDSVGGLDTWEKTLSERIQQRQKHPNCGKSTQRGWWTWPHWDSLQRFNDSMGGGYWEKLHHGGPGSLFFIVYAYKLLSFFFLKTGFGYFGISCFPASWAKTIRPSRKTYSQVSGMRLESRYTEHSPRIQDCISTEPFTQNKT